MERRTMLVGATTLAMAGGLAASYGTFGAMAVSYLYPARPAPKAWLFVTDLQHMAVGDSLVYRAPTGATVAVARQGGAGTAGDFIALSSVCPHLGCQVHWESQNNRFFCPCHNGIFDRTGKATGGPPGDAQQSLARFPLRLSRNLLFIEVPIEGLAAVTGDKPSVALAYGDAPAVVVWNGCVEFHRTGSRGSSVCQKGACVSRPDMSGQRTGKNC